MALRKIVVEGDPVLRKRAREIEKVHNKERMIFDDMVETMRSSNGCGLAAPQVGLLKRMIVVEVPDPLNEIKKDQDELNCEGGFHEEGLPKEEPTFKGDSLDEKVEPEIKMALYQLANPVIISMSGSQTGEEGCLSVPGFVGNVDRPDTIHLSALDYSGELVELHGTGLLAVALCHEIDHLNGVLFTDKATEIQELEVEEE